MTRILNLLYRRRTPPRSYHNNNKSDVTHFVNVGDLTIHDSSSDESSDTYDSDDSDDLETRTKTRKGTTTRKTKPDTEDAGPSGGGSGKVRESGGAEGGKRVVYGDSRSRLGETEIRARASVRVTTENPSTSDTQDARRLQLGRQGAPPPPPAHPQKQKEEEGETEEGEIKKRVRKRMKREIRKRHVNQLFIRGENVVLIAVADKPQPD
ncbi:hypothetical protein Hamer_G005826 [Homarus americanus]|uniref:Uncharacterized protein n=1 Tax=Homarus americanus TaxID=6706 RepID=A0A8J5MMW9_HOMAM|nr:hypothetical protein Hamer_G005826 [Homarus americanus]